MRRLGLRSLLPTRSCVAYKVRMARAATKAEKQKASAGAIDGPDEKPAAAAAAAPADPASSSSSSNDNKDQVQYWLMKAEPDSRIVKGKDVAFSVDHFEKMGTSHWDGVRNPLAKRYMKEDMKLGDKVLFYHSNTKIPGVAALAEVSKEGYPDHTAWDADHPYHDPKSDKDNPKWFMVDVTFKQRLSHFVPLNLFKALADSSQVPEGLSTYLTPSHLAAIKEMPLINRGRLSVQTVPRLAYEATVLLGEKGGFDEIASPAKGAKKVKKEQTTTASSNKAAAGRDAKKRSRGTRGSKEEEVSDGAEGNDAAEEEEEVIRPAKKRGGRA